MKPIVDANSFGPIRCTILIYSISNSLSFFLNFSSVAHSIDPVLCVFAFRSSLTQRHASVSANDEEEELWTYYQYDVLHELHAKHGSEFHHFLLLIQGILRISW
jgi:hypothetical protein